MKALLREALDSEPLLKYSFWGIRISAVMFYYTALILIAITIGAVFMFFDLLSVGSGDAEKESERLINCALQEQWERDHR